MESMVDRLTIFGQAEVSIFWLYTLYTALLRALSGSGQLEVFPAAGVCDGPASLLSWLPIANTAQSGTRSYNAQLPKGIADTYLETPSHDCCWRPVSGLPPTFVTDGLCALCSI